MIEAAGERPTTSVGRSVARYLQQRRLPNLVPLLLRNQRAIDSLGTQAFVIAARRKFRRGPVEPVEAYATEALRRTGNAATPAAVAEGVRALNACLDPDGSRQPPVSRSIGGPLLFDLIDVQHMDGTDIDALVAAAEHRVRHTRSPGYRAVLRARRGGTPPAGPRPRSIVGAQLRALARYDIDTVQALPDDPSYDFVLAAAAHACEAAVRERFGGGRHDEIPAFCREVSRRQQVPAITPNEALNVVLDALGETAPYEAADQDLQAQIRLAVFARAVDDLGLFDRELVSLIRSAEDAAEAEGHALSPWPSPPSPGESH
ncbi:hypothetical protein ACFQ1L_24260 [Phytohabitans flavus]|uniref:hypothetical protein n=1 Tax=Phytohabitans flavus TaxID=1076124 RepID=UPI0015655E79|nr:hypothetical protein [Phytohabitans flavus]